jgi:hypothetical protein
MEMTVGRLLLRSKNYRLARDTLLSRREPRPRDAAHVVPVTTLQVAFLSDLSVCY